MKIILNFFILIFFTGQLFAGDAEIGKKVFNKCKACHSIEQGGKNKIGPNLWNIVNQKAGLKEGYKYSKALLKFSEEGGKWDVSTLTQWLKKPKGLIKKTKMIYPGLKKQADIDNVIAYLKSNGE